jgi:hypothetical protein
MPDSPKNPDEATVTALLKQFGDNVSRFATHASAEEKLTLLRLLKDQQLLELLQAWRYRDRRKLHRRPCSLPVRYTIEGVVFTDVISNISISRALIETSSILSVGEVGQEVTLMISPPKGREPIPALCKILWAGSGRVGLQFTEVTRELREMIESL